MKKIILLIILGLLGIAFLKFGRSVYVPIANKLKGKQTVESVINIMEVDVRKRLETNLKFSGYQSDYPKEIILIAFKEEQKLEVYTKDKNKLQLIKAYPFTGFSGKLGPKLKEGDKQIPEGIYEVEYLNPNSSYHLSIKVNYPNEFDKSKTEFKNLKKLGGDIFIHGKSVTIGCIPIGDLAIEEVFLLTQKAINKKVKVIISPRDFRINPVFPVIDNIGWEKDLYQRISQELTLYEYN